jgi:N-acetylneuraminic acid mutarotase
VNPPFEELPNTIPFGSSYAIAFPSSQKNVIYLFGGITVNVNTGLDDFKSILHSYNLETNEWTIPITSGIAPGRRREFSGVISNNTGKFYAFGGFSDQATGTPNVITLNDMNIFDINSLTWSKGSTINAPLPRTDFTVTLLTNGIIVFIGGRETNAFLDVDINQVKS